MTVNPVSVASWWVDFPAGLHGAYRLLSHREVLLYAQGKLAAGSSSKQMKMWLWTMFCRLDEADIMEEMLSTLESFVCASTSRQSMKCHGICSANIGQKVTSPLQHLELWSRTSWEFMSKQGHGHKQPLLWRIHSWIPCKMGTSNTWLPCWNQRPQRSSQLQRPSLRWSNASVNLTVLLADIPAKS